jgi:hypothetical protein
MAPVRLISDYFDSRRDTSLFNFQEMEELYKYSAWLDLFPVQNIAVHHDLNSKNAQNIEQFLNDWPHLQSLQLVIGPERVIDWNFAFKETHHLIEIQEDMDDDLIFTKSHKEEYHKTAFNQVQSYSLLQQAKSGSSILRGHLADLDLEIPYRSVNFKVCMLGMIHVDDYTTPEAQWIYLLPTNPKYTYVEFQTIIPPKEVPAKERVNYMRVEELACDVACRHDGTLLALHDGEVMKKLFED